MKVLVVGGGGREHALAWKIAQDLRVETVFAAPGSAGMGDIAECVPVGVEDIDGLARLVREQGIDLTVVGPEAPLAAGIVDRFRDEGLRIFGPDRAGAELEASKAFTKRLLVECGVPTGAYGEFTEPGPAAAFARELGYPVVVKADGLAAGKGVIICQDADAVDAALKDILTDSRFGDAGASVVVEEFLAGEEASFIVLTDGQSPIVLAASQDHKAVFDGDRGPNTGGMGAYSPAPVVTDALRAQVIDSVIQPTIDGLRGRGIDFCGVLYAGLMIVDGQAKVLEYNVRFGDPECQPLMMRMDTSLVDLIEACLDGQAAAAKPVWQDDAAVCVVMAAGGYPGSYTKGTPITGIEAADAREGVKVFHAGTARGSDGGWVTAGGRVLGVTARGANVGQAVERAYAGVGDISWGGAQFRRDIAHRALGKRK